jgi:dUTP pyrophosphatase
MIQPGEWADIPTELAVEIPKGYFGMVVPRSGLGFKHRITLINDVGIIDEDYRGNIGLRMVNDGDKPYIVNRGERVAQMIITPYIPPVLVFVDELDETDRGSNGFGSTGK